MNTVNDDENQHAVKSRADAAENHFAGLDVEKRHQSAERREGIVHGIHRAARGIRRDRGEERGIENAETDFLAFHVAIGDGDAELLVNRIAARFRPPAKQNTGEAHGEHRRPDRPAVLLIFRFAAEVIRQRAADAQQREHLEKVRERRGIFKRMRGVGIRIAAAVRAEHLDRDLRRHRALHDGLRIERLIFHHGISLGVNDRFSIRVVLLDGNGLRFDQFRRRVRFEILNHALRYEKNREHEADGQQQIISDARQIHPEIADGRAPCAARCRARARRQPRCRRRRKKNCGWSARPSARNTTSWIRRRSSASWCSS